MENARAEKESGVWGASIQFWQTVATVATVVALVSGGITAISAFVSAWVSNNVSSAIQEDADKRIAEIQARSDEAKAEAAAAIERAAEANVRALEAALALEKYKEHRRLNPEEQAEIASKVKVLKRTQFAISADGTEALHFGIDVAHALVGGGLEWIDWPLPGNVTNLPHDQHTVGIVQLVGTVIRTFNPKLIGARDTIAAALSTPKFEGTNIEAVAPEIADFPAVLVIVGTKR